MRRLLAIGFVWFCCAVAWAVLGSTIVHRTGESSYALLEQVHGLWGPQLSQAPPQPFYREVRPTAERITYYDASGRERERTVTRDVEHIVNVPLRSSHLAVSLELEHRRKGLLWFPTYDVDFEGRYRFGNPTAEPRLVEVVFPLERGHAVYDGLVVSGIDPATGALTPIESTVADANVRWQHSLAPHEQTEVVLRYRSRGTSAWTYHLASGDQTRVDDFSLALVTNFPDVDFPAGTLSPTSHGPEAGGWSGRWQFETLISSAPIGLELPERLNPGPLASRITFFAPVGLLFFFFVVGVLAAASGRQVHPMNYFFFGCAFFAFHLLFAYLVDVLPVFPAFAVSSATSIFLVVTYARLFVGWRFALLEMGASQLLYLVLFSFTFFWEGFTGLAITLGAVATLFVVMQITGRTDWKLSTPSLEPTPATPTPPGTGS